MSDIPLRPDDTPRPDTADHPSWHGGDDERADRAITNLLEGDPASVRSFDDAPRPRESAVVGGDNTRSLDTFRSGAVEDSSLRVGGDQRAEGAVGNLLDGDSASVRTWHHPDAASGPAALERVVPDASTQSAVDRGDVAPRPDLQNRLGPDLAYESFDTRPVVSDPDRPGFAQQGELGDCWLVASINAVVDQRPGWAAETVRDNGDGTASVRLFEDVPGARDGMMREQVSSTSFDLPSTDGGQAPAFAGHDGNDLWPSLVEKTYAARSPEGYDSLDGGSAEYALPALTGGEAERVDTAAVPDVVDWLQNARDEGRPVVAGSLFDHQLRAEPDLEALRRDVDVFTAHEYTVVGADRVTDTVTLQNPWGTRDPRPMTGDEFRRLFPDVAIGSFPDRQQKGGTT